MRVNKNTLHTHKAGHTHRIASVFHKYHKGSAVIDKATVQGDTIHNGAHTKLAHTVIQVVTRGILRRNILRAFVNGQVRASKVS